MRISCKVNDPGYTAEAYKYIPLLNGNVVHSCFTADEDAGYVMVYRKDDSGKYYLDRNGNIASMLITGNVKIIRKTEQIGNEDSKAKRAVV